MDDRQTLAFWLVIWALSIAVLLASQWKSKHPVPSLPMTYVVSLSLIHFFGGVIYALPWYLPQDQYLLDSGTSIEVVARGFRTSTIALVSFVIGSLLIGPKLVPSTSRPASQKLPDRERKKLPATLMVMGALFFGIIAPLLGWIPSIGAAAISGVGLAIVGLGLACWKAWTEESRAQLFKWLGLSAAFPAITVATLGFIGYGTNAAISVWMFVFYFYRPRWQVIVALLAMFYMGLSVWVTYARDREEIRDVVWRGEQETFVGKLKSRVSRVASTFSNFEFMDFHDQRHLEFIDIRLNQNLIVGQATDRLQRGDIDYAKGKTIGMAAVALIPRILWPNKPVTGGGGDIVSDYTGREFSKSSSFGVGQVMEFAINFGMAGVVIGFLLLGSVLRACDLRAGQHLESGDWWRFTAWFIVGLALINPGGNLAEIVGKVAATAALVFGLHHLYFQKLYVPAGFADAASSSPRARTGRTRRPVSRRPSEAPPETTAVPGAPATDPTYASAPTKRVPPGRNRRRIRRPGIGRGMT